MRPSLHADGPVLFFDERCSVCRRFVALAVRADRRETLRIAPLRSARADAMRRDNPAFTRSDSAVWQSEDGTVVGYSDAILATMRFIGGRWRVLALLGGWLPRRVRDWAYRLFAGHRNWFGQFGLRELDAESQRRLLADARPSDATRSARVLDRAAFVHYLNDHLAGSVAALQLMERLCAADLGDAMVRTLRRLKADVEAEQDELRTLIASADGTESAVAQAVGWLGERMSRLKIGPGEHDDSGLMLFEALEAISLGFWGRRALWRALAEVRAVVRIDSRLDFAALATRAEAHLEEIEAIRLLAAQHALGSSVDRDADAAIVS